MTTVYIDFETRGVVDLKSAGVYNYATDAETELICIGWAIDDGPARVHAFVEPDESLLFPYRWKYTVAPSLTELVDAVVEGALVVAHNVAFDRAIWHHIGVKRHRFPIIREDNWRCSSAAAAHYGIPRSLKDAGAFLELAEQKKPPRAVEALSFPLPRWKKTKSGPKWNQKHELYDEMYSYCHRDVEVCREIYKRCPELSLLELAVWRADQRINARGFPVDVRLAQVCHALHERNARAADKAIVEVTRHAVKSTRSAKQVIGWLDSHGVKISNLQAETVRDVLARKDLSPEVRRVLELRVDGAGAASSKYAAILAAAGDDGRVRDAFIYHGGRTGRWSARVVQPHNFIRPPASFSGKGKERMIDTLAESVADGDVELARVFGSHREILAAMLRAVICASEGKTLMCLDFGQVEARITAWFAGEQRLLKMFADGIDVYTDMARKINPQNPNRQLGKAAVLGLGFGMGVNTFIRTCASWGIDADESTIEKAVFIFRETFPGIPKLWSTLAYVAQEAISKPDKPIGRRRRLRFLYRSSTGILEVALPSGRELFYHRAELDGDGIKYWARIGPDDTGAVGWVRAWGGKLVENIVQATAACLLREAIVRLEEQLVEAPVIFHAHDEIVVECNHRDSERLYDDFHRIVTQSPPWASGLPIAADGWRERRYRK